MKLGAIEAGGTKFVVATGDENGRIISRATFPTTTPEETMAEVYRFFDDSGIAALGIGTFGPIDPDVNSPTYGYITTTPKPGWANFAMLPELQKRYTIPMGFDTDVNGAALGEVRYGAAKGLDSCLYLTIGTGIGGGAIVEGKLAHGLLHPEMGHIALVRHPHDNMVCNCPYHDHCFEGLAAGPAIAKRWGKKGDELDKDHEAWDMEAYYIGQALATYILVLSPKKIILGGGVMKQTQLFPKIRRVVKECLNGYIQKEEITAHIDDYIVPPGLGDNAGICGALALAYDAASSPSR